MQVLSLPQDQRGTMPVQLERDLHRRCVKHARENGFMVLKVETVVNVGWPDVIIIPPLPCDGHRNAHPNLWVEFKREGAELSPIQERIQRLLVERGQRVYTVRSVASFKELLAPYV